MQPSDQTALVTGASSGIGAAIATRIAEEGINLILTARRADRLEQLASQLKNDLGVTVHCLAADLADPAAPQALMLEIEQQGLQVDWLVNNAGYGVGGSYVKSDWDTHRDFMQVMLGAVAELTWRVLPAMKERGFGRIVNIASLAALVPASAGHTQYAAVKAWMVKFSESLSLEMAPRGVTVTAVCPGFTYSEFHDVLGIREQISQMPNYMWMTSEEVADQAVKAAIRGDRVYINGRVNRIIAGMSRHLPKGLMDFLVQRRAKSYRRDD
ncbi:MAG: SDR family oxidoreductase [Xanthomonadales bacterium]|nr:SDR family oxidoreductase [Xanthomonadales bacterium]